MHHLKLDTLDKKPKIYNVAILTAAVLALLAVVFLLQRAWMLRFSCLLLALYFLAVAALAVCLVGRSGTHLSPGLRGFRL
ncbi:MAG: hypothetical protein VZQ75_09430 [Candidatus Faecousia sp.]|nr:hypothetical protein [Candidatus Faecousia sp.]